MKKIFIALTVVSSFILNLSDSAKADWDKVMIYNPEGGGSEAPYQIYKLNSTTGKYTLQTTSSLNENDYDNVYYDHDSGQLRFQINHQKDYIYDFDDDKWSRDTRASWRDDFDGGGTLIDRFPPIRRDGGGIISIGENSLKLRETDTQQQLWGTNADGDIVPLNIINGSKLLINGRDVEQSINNVGAMSAALTGLPTVPTDSNLACGLGTGTHGGDFAFSVGCASKVNENLSINYASSITMPGQQYPGDFEDKFSARAGFIWQLGKSNKPTQISMHKKKEMDLKISKLVNDNEKLKKKNNEIISQHAKLLTRLEKLENNAFRSQKSEEFSFHNGL